MISRQQIGAEVQRDGEYGKYIRTLPISIKYPPPPPPKQSSPGFCDSLPPPSLTHLPSLWPPVAPVPSTPLPN